MWHYDRVERLAASNLRPHAPIWETGPYHCSRLCTTLLPCGHLQGLLIHLPRQASRCHSESLGSNGLTRVIVHVSLAPPRTSWGRSRFVFNSGAQRPWQPPRGEGAGGDKPNTRIRIVSIGFPLRRSHSGEPAGSSSDTTTSYIHGLLSNDMM